MPRKAVADEDDEMPRPRRKRGAAAAAIKEDSGRGILMRVLMYSPKDMVAGLLALTAASAVVANALFLQHGPHPAPMFGSVVHLPSAASPTANLLLPRPRPIEADATPAEPRLAEPRPSELRLSDVRAADPRSVDPRSVDPRSVDPLGSLVKATTTGSLQSGTVASSPSANVPRPPAPVPPVQVTGSRRVAAVQRVLTEYGYGQLRASGTIGADTQAAIQKFEREHKLPVTGQVSDRLVRDLGNMIGHPID